MSRNASRWAAIAAHAAAVLRAIDRAFPVLEPCPYARLWPESKCREDCPLCHLKAEAAKLREQLQPRMLNEKAARNA